MDIIDVAAQNIHCKPFSVRLPDFGGVLLFEHLE